LWPTRINGQIPVDDLAGAGQLGSGVIGPVGFRLAAAHNFHATAVNWGHRGSGSGSGGDGSNGSLGDDEAAADGFETVLGCTVLYFTEDACIVVVSVFASDLSGGVSSFDLVRSISAFVSIGIAAIRILRINVSQNWHRGSAHCFVVISQIEV